MKKYIFFYLAQTRSLIDSLFIFFASNAQHRLNRAADASLLFHFFMNEMRSFFIVSYAFFYASGPPKEFVLILTFGVLFSFC